MECIDKMMEDFDNLERKMKYKELSRFESTSSEIPLKNTGKLPPKPKEETPNDEFEEYEKEMNKVLKDVIKKPPTEEKNEVEESSEEHPPETILDIITDFIERMWEG